MWFEKLTGFTEKSPNYVRENLIVDGKDFISKVNNERFSFGELEVSTLAELKNKSPKLNNYTGKIKVKEIVADVGELHCNPENSNALFQAASQFNLLEMISPSITPEQGIDKYESDYTQGPVCAINCGAGTIYRNYFVNMGNLLGQTAENQIDCLDLMGLALENEELNLWEMKNGYALISQEGLLTINKKLAKLNHAERESLKDKLKVGIQWNTEVTKSTTRHKVSQIYCSALPVAYCQTESSYWESFARVILEATYEATLYTALINLEKHKSNLVYLTLVGGGAFGNEENWILESMQQAIRKFKSTPLDIKIVSYGRSNSKLLDCINEI
ncbi:MAG: hypothetical protein ACR2MS_03240 [Weeksellaceae bacterium]